ncbi:MAG: zinc ABC transporter substrate-binding protein [bacterium]|nr:zinc ABC transporter substrate-binding protein [bacterium]
MRRTLIFLSLMTITAKPIAAEPIRVVSSLPVYASIAQLVGGDRVEASSIARGDEDAHFVKPKPSFALMLRDADLFVSTGLDLELWAPVLIDKSRNRAIREGEPGWVSASAGVPLLDQPETIDRSAGDVHVYGNPHIFTSPLNAKLVARNIAAGLKRVDPAGAAHYDAGLARFERRIDEALYGADLVEILGAATLDPLARQGKLVAFLESQEYQGEKLIGRLGGWLGRGLAFRDRQIVVYHKNWIYLTELFGLEVVETVEPKPGIPPSARHVKALIDHIRSEDIQVLLAATYFSPRQVEAIAERTGCRAVRVPLGTGTEGADDYFSLVDLWVERLAEAFGS